ncbi:hypothetical protein KP509_01G082200 [Ceratopteris richardii]|uniref:Bifunctional inhibitor/plant lipid transfer protein/seed storage helical domain-containing protein n=1 Tax=Ceratopteris richardii TaxID=49495 RepID=A0A8T2VLD4_CERRI|nr:hypothetical protein KP509_01G082200 [Ceratopteris richardii]KAH7446924.1 hypothetical protein KP509_01G082200 [Ceratopteris richardii]
MELMRVVQLLCSTIAVFMLACASISEVVEAAADIGSCPDALTKLLPCLPYSQGKTDVPTKDCCTNLEDVHVHKPQCLCALIAASANGTQGLPPMNTTLALQLGPACKVGTKPSTCPDLLGLAPSDPLVKIFTGAQSNAPTSGTSPPTAPSSNLSASPKNSSTKNFSITVLLRSLILTAMILLIVSLGI